MSKTRKFGDASNVFLGLKQKPPAENENALPNDSVTDEVQERLAQVADRSPLITTQIKAAEKPIETHPPEPAGRVNIPPAPVKPIQAAAPETDKVVKGSFSMPPADHDLLVRMEHTCMRNLRKAPPSLLLRLGIRLLSTKSDTELLALVDANLAEGKGNRRV